MKLLKVDNQEGYYFKQGEYKKVDSITKEDILILLRYIYEEDEIELDEMNDVDNRITLPSQSLVYEKLYEKLVEMMDKKNEIISSVSSEFKEAIEKYCTMK